jgi:hypothetical protein
MNDLRIGIFVSVVSAGLLALGPQVATARAQSARTADRVLTGELVATNAAANRFRLVGHTGQFTAPAGTSVEALDGKPVRVTLSHGGRVIAIDREEIRYEPITHGFEIVTGKLVPRSGVPGEFTLVGDDHAYVAPARIDVQRYAGRLVQVSLDDRGRVMSVDLAKGAAAARAAANCTYQGRAYSEGASLCQAGARYRCEAGMWESLGMACTNASAQPCDFRGASYAVGATRCTDGSRFVCEAGRWRGLGTACEAGEAVSTRTCAVGGATVAAGSSICRDGTAFRCVDGEWVNLGTACS